ncbi:IclR family transcriptional regulator [Hydrogenophaga sp. BPS33]|uniref:IclR family transcriptional regulator n=1 Tax=Hydrogenophaga sp. BPS33 TaxID=2651974 RepID=UPI001F45C396|nr:IclR family transcriptional regulator C-terminal domain-containing protein [Hydrogenophaga sp. BPS33]
MPKALVKADSNATTVAASRVHPSGHREVPAVRRACAVMWLLARHPDGITLSSVARELDILPSTCLHILRELGVGRLVAYDAIAKVYRLGSGVLSLSSRLTQQNPFVQVAQPHLNRLSREFEVAASAQELDGDSDMLVVAAAAVQSGRPSPGGRTPLLIGASGRVMAAYGALGETELRRRFARLGWQDPPELEQWLRDVRDVPVAGHAVDDGNFRKGITAIAAPVFHADGSVTRTISVTAVSAQLASRQRKQLAEAAKVAAAQITNALR